MIILSEIRRVEAFGENHDVACVRTLRSLHGISKGEGLHSIQAKAEAKGGTKCA